MSSPVGNHVNERCLFTGALGKLAEQEAFLIMQSSRADNIAFRTKTKQPQSFHSEAVEILKPAGDLAAAAEEETDQTETKKHHA